MTVQKKILDLTGSQYLVQKVKSAINDVDSSLSTHIADTDIHVTTADKNRWNNNTYVFRYSSTALVASSTNSNTLLDNTDNLKVGDKVIDSSGVLFSITAIDTQNSTFTIGTALIDLAQDSDVVHKTGNETVGGEKTFTNDVTVNNSNASVQTDVPNLIFQNPLVERASTTLDGEQTILFTDKNANNVASIQAKTYTSGISDIILTSYSEYNGVKTTGIMIRRTPTTSKFQAFSDNITTLGESNRRWKSVYAMSYYYGNDNVEFSTKFVTTDTNQTISGAKTFSDTLTIYNNDSSQNTKNLTISSSKIQVGDTSNSDSFGIVFNAGASYVSRIMAFKDTSGTQNLQFGVRTKDSSNNYIVSTIRSRIYVNGFRTFESDGDNLVSLGSSSNKWKDVQTYQVNNLEPSSLSLPSGNASDVIDISSYITNLNGTPNSYVPPVNGYLSFTFSSGSQIQIYPTSGGGVGSKWASGGSAGIIRGFMPVLKNSVIRIVVNATTMDSFVFVPCQGNV